MRTVQNNSTQRPNNMDVICALDNNQIKSHGEPEIPKLNFSFSNPDSPQAGCSVACAQTKLNSG